MDARFVAPLCSFKFSYWKISKVLQREDIDWMATFVASKPEYIHYLAFMVPSQMCKLLMLRALKHPQTVLNPSGMLAFELCANKKLDALFTLQDVLFASVFTEKWCLVFRKCSWASHLHFV